MKRAVIVGGVVTIKAGLDQLIYKPAVDAFVEVRRFYPKEEKSQERRQGDNDPRSPFRLGERTSPCFNRVAKQRKIR